MMIRLFWPFSSYA